ncbi:MAG: hypothetical protein LQ351_007190 [Letrouitia transgressa]|nr:MAG: hypothetical protein LQ351_007190 [Letrouitia transgressa]
MQFSNIPELAQSGYDETSTDSSPSPSMFYSSFDNVDCSLYPNHPDTAQYLEQQAILNSIEFTDLTAPQHEDRRRRKSTTMQDKQTITNMRIRRRAQNRASQRAFRERKEKHVQHLEQELETLETKYQNLSKSHSDLGSVNNKLKQEVESLRKEIKTLRSTSYDTSPADQTSPGHAFDQFDADFTTDFSF